MYIIIIINVSGSREPNPQEMVSSTTPAAVVSWLCEVPATHRMHLKDGAAKTIARAGTLKQLGIKLDTVLLSDAFSTLQALQPNRDTDHNDLSAALASICRSHAVTLQWIPSHCNLPGNEVADSLAKESTTKEQLDRSTSYAEVKTILKAKQHSK